MIKDFPNPPPNALVCANAHQLLKNILFKMDLRLPPDKWTGSGVEAQTGIMAKLTCQAGGADLCPLSTTSPLSVPSLSTFLLGVEDFLASLVCTRHQTDLTSLFEGLYDNRQSDKPVWVTAFLLLQDRITFS